MRSLKAERISKIHNSSWRIALALTGGGSKFIPDLLTIPGGSQTLLEAIVPYSSKALDLLLGCTPEHYCSGLTARQMAMAAFYRAQTISGQYYRPDNTSSQNISSDNVAPASNPPSINEKIMPTQFPFPTKIPDLVGIGVTAALASSRPKKGTHRIFVALQSFHRTLELSLELIKDARSREEEELVAAEFILSAFEYFISLSEHSDSFKNCHSDIESIPVNKNNSKNINQTIDNLSVKNSSETDTDIQIHNDLNNNIQYINSALTPNCLRLISLSEIPLPYLKPLLINQEHVTGTIIQAGTNWSSLLFSQDDESPTSAVDGIIYKNRKFTSFSRKEVCEKISPESRLIFPGSFRPIHHGHEGMIQAAENKFHLPVNLEISVRNVDKPPLDFYEIIQRLNGIENSPASNTPIWFTHYPKFIDKTCFFPGQFFIVGTDTLVRIADPKYDGSIEAHKNAIREIASRGIHFVHFNRRENGIIWGLDHLNLEPDLRAICLEIPPEIFVDDISSTLLRKQNPQKE